MPRLEQQHQLRVWHAMIYLPFYDYRNYLTLEIYVRLRTLLAACTMDVVTDCKSTCKFIIKFLTGMRCRVTPCFDHKLCTNLIYNYFQFRIRLWYKKKENFIWHNFYRAVKKEIAIKLAVSYASLVIIRRNYSEIKNMLRSVELYYVLEFRRCVNFSDE